MMARRIRPRRSLGGFAESGVVMSLREEPKPFGSNAPAVDEAPSQALLPIAVPTLLLVCQAGIDADAICSSSLGLGIRPVQVPRLELAPPPDRAPSHCVLDLSIPGAGVYLEAIAKLADHAIPIALLDSRDGATEAYRLGAVTTLVRPVEPALITAILSGQRRRILQLRHADVVVEHGRRVSTTNAFEGLLRALGQDVRNPLATALANVEYLSELNRGGTSPMTPSEDAAVVGDTLSSLQQIRMVLESVSALIPKVPPDLNRIRLWSVAQRVLDDLPTGIAPVTIVGDADVRGWGDEANLFEVVGTLVRRALLASSDEDRPPQISIHVYAHDTEARLTVRDYASQSSDERTTGDPFHPGLTLGKPGQSGLLLTAARHAIVRMGGTLSYVPKTKTGCAFRVRLRIAQPSDT